MITKTFTKSDGSKGESYFPENKEEYVSLNKTVGVRQHPAVVNGKAVIIENHFLGVKTKDGREIVLNLSKGQKKALDKTDDLTGKTIFFEKYEHKQYGKLLGARIKKELIAKQ